MNYTIFIGRKITDTTKILLLQNNVSFKEGTLIDIQLNRPDLSLFRHLKKKRKNWVITSSWAAKWLKINYREIEFNTDEAIFCLSEKQADILKEFSSRIFISEEPNAKSVFELAKQKNTGEAIVFLSGNKSLSVFEDEFQSKEFNFYKIEIYRNVPVHLFFDNQFDAYLFFSPSGIESFIDAGNHVPSSAYIFTIGKTTGFSAKQYFQNAVLESPVQEETGFIAFAVNRLKTFQTQPVKSES